MINPNDNKHIKIVQKRLGGLLKILFIQFDTNRRMP